MLRIGSFLSVFILLSWWIPGFSESAQQDNIVDIQLRWHHQFQFAGYYAAVEKGFYREEGLDVRLHAGDPNHQPVSEVLAGRAMYAEGNSEVLYQRLLGKPLVALAAIFQHSPSVLLTRQDSEIHSVHDFIGKKVMLMNLTEDADFLTMFLSEGISLVQVSIEPSSYNLDDLIFGKVDAFNSYLTNEPYFLKQRNIPYNIIDPRNYRIDFYSDVLFTTESELNDHPRRVEAIRRASVRGWHYAMDHPDEIIDLILSKYSVEKTRGHLEFEAAEMRKLIFPDLIEIGHMNPGRWQHMAETFVKAGLIKPNYSLDGFIYNPVPAKLPEWMMPVLIVVITLLSILSLATYTLHRFNRHLTQTKDTLRQGEERLRLALNAANQSWFDLYIPTGAISVSEEYSKILGYQSDDFRTDLQEWQSKLHPDDRGAVMNAFGECLRHGGPISIEYRLSKKDGNWVWLNSVGKIIEWGSQHQAIRMIGIHTDISVRKKAETHSQLAASVFTHAREGILITDIEGNIVELNETFVELSGYSREEVLGKNPRLFNSGVQSAEFYTLMWKALFENDYWNGEIWNLRKNGELYAGMLTISTVRDSNGTPQHYVALYTDITQLKQQQQQLEHIAHYDALTNLPNRVLLADRLKQGIAQSDRRKQYLVVAYLDLDGFKQVNDTYGHEVGDELLVNISLRMKTALREGDTLARIGGDEFVAVLVDLEQVTDFEQVLTRLLQSAATPVRVNNILLQVSASIGATIYPQDGVDVDQLMRHADQAMYVAKQSGKNRYHLFDINEDTAVKSQYESLEQIRSGFVREEFVLYYQPKVNLKTGAVMGVEALIRWQHPERGLLLPEDFLTIIENHQFSVELGEWIIDTALTQLTQWHAIGMHIPVSVNVGARQLQQHDFVDRLKKLLAKHPDIQPGYLELELLETSALEDITEVSGNMYACREIGVRFALDDFGTGYSSLTYLKRLPVDMLKIDQSFVRDMLDDPEDFAIVKGVIGLASAFHREVIAEGVESIAHGAQLLALGCVFAQGYGIARPMPGFEIATWAANWRPDESWMVS